MHSLFFFYFVGRRWETIQNAIRGYSTSEVITTRSSVALLTELTGEGK